MDIIVLFIFIGLVGVILYLLLRNPAPVAQAQAQLAPAAPSVPLAPVAPLVPSVPRQPDKSGVFYNNPLNKNCHQHRQCISTNIGGYYCNSNRKCDSCPSDVLEQREFHIKRNTVDDKYPYTCKKQKVCTQHTQCSPKSYCAKSQFGQVCTPCIGCELYNDGIDSNCGNRCFPKHVIGSSNNVIVPSNLPTMTTMGLNTNITEITAAALNPVTAMALSTEFVPTTISS
jgi:hypothetical protein